MDVVNHIVNGHNVLMHGCGGTGKSYTIRFIAKQLKLLDISCWCVATTGIAALGLAEPGIKTRTLHSWAGIGLGDLDAKKLYSRIVMDDRAFTRWTMTRVLIIDEISMLGETLLTKLDYIGRKVRNCFTKPFGGLQIVASGDFLQLPPVKDDWAFTAPVWPELNFVVVPFLHPMRYDDLDWFQLLLRIRDGSFTPADIARLETRVEAYDEYENLALISNSIDVKPTMIYSLKRDVSSFNMTELAKLTDEEFVYKAHDTYKKIDKSVNVQIYERMFDESIAPVLILKIGAQVMLKANVDINRGLVNGSRGVITKCEKTAVYVKFYSINIPVRIIYNTWTLEDDRIIANRSQLPFILAWATTVHSIQGCTLDYAICDIGSSIFADGQAYVALSRVRNISGLFLKNLNPDVIRANRYALEYLASI